MERCNGAGMVSRTGRGYYGMKNNSLEERIALHLVQEVDTYISTLQRRIDSTEFVQEGEI